MSRGRLVSGDRVIAESIVSTFLRGRMTLALGLHLHALCHVSWLRWGQVACPALEKQNGGEIDRPTISILFAKVKQLMPCLHETHLLGVG